jgi:penicillin G amidase
MSVIYLPPPFVYNIISNEKDSSRLQLDCDQYTCEEEIALAALLGRRKTAIKGYEGNIFMNRDKNGIPVICASSLKDLYFGLGWIHAHDRFLNMEVGRIVARGRGAECFDPSLLKLDIEMRRYSLLNDAEAESARLNGKSLQLINAYCAGVNQRLETGSLPFEFKLLGHRPDSWTPADSIITAKLIGVTDLTETQGWMEKFIIQLIKQDVSLKMIKELFPYLTEEPDREYLEIIRQVRLTGSIVPESIKWAELPRLQCSNNWVVRGEKSKSGKPIFCGDPHLDTSRLPAIWQEVIMESGDFFFIGATVPGIPGPAMGRTNYLAWSPTYGNIDVIDYFIEDVKDGLYRCGSERRSFNIREELFAIRNSDPVRVRYFENEHGVLEEEPVESGYYPCLAWSAARNCGAETIKNMFEIPLCRNAEDALERFSELDFAAFNWVVADTKGNIGYRMSGRNPVRKEGCSGLLPLPGWDKSYNWQGFHDRKSNPSLFNPPEQYIVTANQDLNHLSPVRVINIAMAPYRTRRISELLAVRDDHSVESMKKMQYDIYSKQAEDFMKLFRPLLPDSEAGKILAGWDLVYSPDSLAPTLFENILSELLWIVFGELNFGREVFDFLANETILLHDYYWNFDRILLGEDSAWFRGRKREDLYREAIERGLAIRAESYGKSRKIMMRHLLLGGRLPRFLGFDYGPLELIGGRATISISQIFKESGRVATFSPTYRFITDLAEEIVHSVLAGGPSDRRFSKWYVSGLPGWIAGKYNELTRNKQDN